MSDFVDHIDYMVKTIGLEHWEFRRTSTAAAALTGWNSASETFNVTLELIKRGCTEEQIGKLWSGTLLRVVG
jgi:membrane dipeptidase